MPFPKESAPARVYICCWPGCDAERRAPYRNDRGSRIKTPYCREHLAVYRRQYRRANRSEGRCACGRDPVEGTARCERCTSMHLESAARTAPTPEELRERALEQERRAHERAGIRAERAALAARLGPVLRARRVAQGLDQTSVAKRLGTTQQTIARYELGRSMPSDRTLARLAGLYETTVDGFLEACAQVPGERVRLPRRRRASDERRATADRVGLVLLELRLTLDLSQAEVAKAASVTPGAISSYEAGRSLPGDDVLRGLARLFGATPEEILAEPSPVRGRERLEQDARARAARRSAEKRRAAHVRPRQKPGAARLGPVLRSLRLDRGLTQVQVAARLGLTRQRIAQCEKGDVAPRGDALDSLAKVYGTTSDALLEACEHDEKKRRARA